MRPVSLNTTVATALGMGPGDRWIALKKEKGIAGLKNVRPTEPSALHTLIRSFARQYRPKVAGLR